MRILGAFVAALALCGANAATRRVTVNPSAAAFAKAKRVVADSLKDPSSAQFRDLRIVTDDLGTRKVCGQVNAKNVYGGYVGFRDFAYLTASGGFEIVDSDNLATVVSSGCD